MKIQSFGCSFLSGAELASPDQTWPALIAKQLGAEHENYAWPGVGNLYILTKILNHAQKGSVACINWTFIDRFDFCSSSSERWETLRPSLDHEHAEFYFSRLHGQYRDMLTSLTNVKLAIDFLNENDIDFVMTYMDDLFFEQVQPEWHRPQAIDYLQNYIKPYVKNFDGLSFLDWALYHKFPVSEQLHPLDRAHARAAAYWKNEISRCLSAGV